MFLSIRALHEEGVSKKAIARRLGIDRRTVREYIRRIARGEESPRRAVVPRKLDAHAGLIQAKAEQGLSAVQIYQDLRADAGFDASYESVKRRVRSIRPRTAEVYCRMTFKPGEEAQLDFGEISRLRAGDRVRKVYLFAMTLCFSRYSYYDLVTDQTVPTFLDAIRRAFEFFGGVPARIKPDNLKAAVLIDQFAERHYQEDFFRFCQHYGTVPDAARPATPTDKGRTERDIGYVKGSCFRGRDFESLEDAKAHLARWRDEIALVRVHGTTRRRPVDLFLEEKPQLRPLPESPYEVAEWGRYKVRKDCHIHVAHNYYSVPHRLVGKKVLVRLTARDLTVFDELQCVASHARALGEGQDVTEPSHYPPEKRIGSHELHRQRLLLVRAAGHRTAEYLHHLHEGQLVFGDQVARMARLVTRFGAAAVEGACERALFFGAVSSARIIESILARRLPAASFASQPHTRRERADFERPLSEYAELLSLIGEAS
jgi:transposase